MRPALLAGLSGAAMATGQAPLGLWPLALAGTAGLIWLVAQQPLRGWRTAWIAGAVHFALALSWIVSPFFVEPDRHGWMAPFALVLMAGGLALFWALAGWAARFARWPGAGFAAALAVAETARGHVLTGFPWAQPGHVWLGTPVDQLAAILGPDGLTLLTLGVALTLTLGRKALIGGLVLALAFGFGLWRLAQPLPDDRPVTLRLVQPNVAQELKFDPDRARATFQRLLTLTAGTAPADLTIWPETALPFLLEPDSATLPAIAAAAGGNPVILGAQRAQAGAEFWNALVVVQGAGDITATYDKSHLVPFGEYFPMGDLAYAWFGLREFSANTGAAYSAGPGPATLNLGPLGIALPLICYEAIFPRLTNAAPARADWIVQITNDAWFGTLTGPFQHLALNRLRAVEQGLPLVRVANTGVTGIYNARGREIVSLPFGTEGVLDTALPGPLPPTPYSRWGDTPVWLLLAGLLAATFASARRRGN